MTLSQKIQNLFGRLATIKSAERRVTLSTGVWTADKPCNVKTLEARRSLLQSDSWDLYSTTDRPMLPTGSMEVSEQYGLFTTKTRNYTVELPNGRKGEPELVASDLSLSAVFQRMSDHEKLSEKVAPLTNKNKRAATLGGRPLVGHVEIVAPEDDAAYWKNVQARSGASTPSSHNI